MRNRCFVALAVALMVGFTIVEAQARPGGAKRGARPKVGAGARPENLRSGNIGSGGQFGQGAGNLGGKLQSQGGNVAGNLNEGVLQNKASQLKNNFTPANQPFTPAWYADHPAAWQYTHPHADAWAVATFGAAAGWLGITATTGGYAADSGTVYTNETSDGDDPAADESRDDDQPQDEADATEASSAPEGEFLPLGVFALSPKSEKDATAWVQLAVNKQGNLRGNYFDVLSGQDQTIWGTVDKKTQRATFQVGPNGIVAYETTLANLTGATGSVTLRFENGQTRSWTLARLDNPAPDAGHR